MAAQEANMPFIKHLASSDRKTRTSALASLRTFLSAPATAARLTPLDHRKLWKGLYYSLWMCDRPLPQQTLCADLAALVHVFGGAAPALRFLQAFWETMAREWTSIDVLRMEKFLLLVRRVLGACLGWALEGDDGQGGKGKKGKGKKGRGKREEGEGEGEGEGRIEPMLRLLSSWPFEATGDLSKVPVGLRLHCLDIWVDEVERLGLLEAEASEEGKTFLDRIRALVDVQTKSTCKPVRARAKESLADERLPGNGGGSSDEDGDEEMVEDAAGGAKDSWDGFED
ncbi:hypothetical protein F5B20DRAFT_573395 [Whalleya microplaca]|nr:hypothetical protein F5B20DRAFT_573395 [Whalleya microplaca]